VTVKTLPELLGDPLQRCGQAGFVDNWHERLGNVEINSGTDAGRNDVQISACHGL
jgi:hypothetical protein